jgi:NTP pyrophosphatase (non-canonical NTP hydrolase)
LTDRRRAKECPLVKLQEFQQLIERIYLKKDRARGLDADFRWFMEEVGELARALRSGNREDLSEEFADVLAWLATMASLCDIELAEAARKYADGCPKCGDTPCCCP